MSRVLVLIAVNCIAMMLVVAFLGNRLVFYPSRHPEGTWSADGLGDQFFDVQFSTEDQVRLHGWWAPAQSEKTLLWCHGNSGNITHRLDLLQFFTTLNVQVLLFDYRGYGKSEGDPHENGLYRDAKAAYRFLVDEQEVSPDQLLIFGRSLGGAIATHLGAGSEHAGVILESTFTNIPDISNASMPIPFLYLFLRARLDALSRIDQINQPTLHLHGRQDEVVPVSLGRRLFEQAVDPKTWIEFPDAEHDDIRESDPDTYRNVLKTMIHHPEKLDRIHENGPVPETE